jgi:hypothetical protein
MEIILKFQKWYKARKQHQEFKNKFKAIKLI